MAHDVIKNVFILGDFEIGLKWDKSFLLFSEYFFWGTAKATLRHLYCRCVTCKKSNTFRSYLWVQSTVWIYNVFYLSSQKYLQIWALLFIKSSISCVWFLCVWMCMYTCICVHTLLQVDDEGELFYSLDDGHTRFTDLIQLVEFYQLNRGVLPCKLKHHCAQITLWTWGPKRPPRAQMHLNYRAFSGQTLPVFLCLEEKERYPDWTTMLTN